MKKQTKVVVLTLPNGESFPWERKAIKRMHLHIRPDGGLYVSTPMRAGEGDVLRFVTAHAEWIERHRQTLAKRGGAPLFETGEIFPVWGEPYTLQTREGRQAGVRIAGGVAYLTHPSGADLAKKQTIVYNFYHQILREAIEKRLPYWQEKVGVTARGVSVKVMKTRWGSCNPRTGHVNISTALARFDPTCLDYVLVHELIHVLVPNHSDAFWRRVGEVYPRYRETVAHLRGNAPLWGNV